MKPMISVIIPCRNEAQAIDRCLDSVLNSDYPRGRVEVIVADGMSQDGTRERLARHAARDPRVRWIDNPGRTTPEALNRALAAATGDLILRLDARAEIAGDYIARAVERLESSQADCVGGAMRTVAAGEGVFAAPIRIALSSRFGAGNAHFRIGSGKSLWVDTVYGACWRREVFERIGRFDERLERSQDIEFSSRLRRAGGKILMAPEMKIDYYPRPGMADLWRHNCANGLWAILPFAYVRGMAVRWRHLAPLALVVGLAISMASGVYTGNPWAGSSVAGTYITANFAASVRAAVRERKASLLFLLPVVFASLHLAYGAGSVWGCVRLPVLFLRNVFEPHRTARLTESGHGA